MGSGAVGGTNPRGGMTSFANMGKHMGNGGAADGQNDSSQYSMDGMEYHTDDGDINGPDMQHAREQDGRRDRKKNSASQLAKQQQSLDYATGSEDLSRGQYNPADSDTKGRVEEKKKKKKKDKDRDSKKDKKNKKKRDKNRGETAAPPTQPSTTEALHHTHSQNGHAAPTDPSRRSPIPQSSASYPPIQRVGSQVSAKSLDYSCKSLEYSINTLDYSVDSNYPGELLIGALTRSTDEDASQGASLSSGGGRRGDGEGYGRRPSSPPPPSDEDLFAIGWAKALDPDSNSHYYFTLDRTKIVWDNPLEEEGIPESAATSGSSN